MSHDVESGIARKPLLSPTIDNTHCNHRTPACEDCETRRKIEREARIRRELRNERRAARDPCKDVHPCIAVPFFIICGIFFLGVCVADPKFCAITMMLSGSNDKDDYYRK